MIVVAVQVSACINGSCSTKSLQLFLFMSAQLEAFPGSYTVECDLSQPDSMARASTQILSRTRHVGVLVHNAATVGAIQPMALVSCPTC
jgi:NAD(P)-dependent dehydrogenase (short-subunit alcohol dehydrogenase family)